MSNRFVAEDEDKLFHRFPITLLFNLKLYSMIVTTNTSKGLYSVDRVKRSL
jgi:hypothetical protein